MGGGSGKRTAARNDKAIQNLQIAFAAVSGISILLRFLLGRIGVGSPLKHWLLLALPFAPSITLTNYLIGLASPRRDSSGNIVHPGGDLDQSGITEWCFDVLYLTWACQVGSAIFGPWFWLLYLTIPLFAIYKLWNLVSPFFLASRGTPEDETKEEPVQSKRQQKLQQRADKGDPRVKVASRR